MSDTGSDNKRIAKNTLFLSLRMLLVMLVTLYTSRIILNALGVVDFGLYNVIGGVISLIAFVNGSMSNATQRYIAFELGKGEAGHVEKVFNTCMMIHILIALLIFFFAETVGLFILNHYMTIPADKLTAANWVYQISILSCLTMVVNTPYNGAIVAYERMEVFAYIALLDVFFRLGVSFLITYWVVNKLVLYAALLFVGQICIRFSYTLYCRNKLPQIRFRMIWDESLIKDLSKFMGWTLFNNMSIIACTQGINILLNIYFNPVVNAARGIAVQVESAIGMFSKNFQMAMNPQIIKSYSMNDRARFFELIFTASRLSFFLLLLLAFPILAHIEYILGIWLIEVPDYTVCFTQLVILISLISVLTDPLLTAVSASGVIKYFQLVSGLLLVSVLPISVITFHFTNSPDIVFIIYLCMTFIVYGYKLYYSILHLSFPLKTYFHQVLLRLLLVSTCCISVYCIYYQNKIYSDFKQFIGSFILCFLFVGTAILFIGLKSEEKDKIICYLKSLPIYGKNFRIK